MATVSPFPILFMIVVMLFAGGLASHPCNAASNSPEVRVGTELDFPPYAFVDESGRPAGFSIEVIRAVSDAMGLSIKISTGSWDTVWNALVVGQLDVLPIVAKLPERQRLVDFSLPHTETYDAFFVRDGDPPIKNIAAAHGMEIVVMRSDAAHHELLERNFQRNLVLVDTIPEGLSLISSGKHNAFLCSKLIGTLLIKKHGLRGLTAGPPIPDYKRIFSFAVKKGDAELLEKLNQGLLIVKTSGEYDRIYDKWLTSDDPWLRVRKYLLPAIIMVVAIALIAGVWLVTLQRLVKKRNRELAERKRAEEALRESEAFIKAILDNLPVGIAVNSVVPAVTFSYMNDNFPRFYRTTREKLTEPDAFWSAVYEDPEFREVIKKKVLGDCASGDPAQMYWEDVPITRNGYETAFLCARNIPIPDRQLMISTVWDVTERKQMEEEIKRSRDELEIRVRERTAQLERSNQDLQAFAFIAAHDLQEPLRKVITFGKLLKDNQSEALGEEGEDYLRRMVNATERMRSLLDSLLDYSRVSTKAVPFTKVDLTTLIREVLSDLEATIEETAGEVQVEDLPVVTADPAQMRQLFQNLIGNALKFRRVGDKPFVRVRSTAATEGETLQIAVEDNGIGFDESAIDKIFKPFQRLHGRTSPYEGTGMGLAICRRIVERHGGTITAKSAQGQGSSFIVKLPKKQ